MNASLIKRCTESRVALMAFEGCQDQLTEFGMDEMMWWLIQRQQG